MRITTGMMVNKYLKNLNKAESAMNYTSEQVSTGRSFFKGSEDPISAIKSYKLRREYKKTDVYATNISDADSVLTMAESNLTQINDNIQSAYKSIIQGVTDTMTSEDRQVIVEQLSVLQDSMLTELNAQVEDEYVFGGTSREKKPFTLDGDGNLLYKGFDVRTTEQSQLEKLANEAVYIDVGLGLEIKDGVVESSSAFDISMAGIKYLGYGVDENGLSNNLYSLIGDIKKLMMSDDYSSETLETYTDKFLNNKDNVLKGITEVGSKSKYLDYLDFRNEDSQDNLTERIKEVEYVDTAEAATNFALQEYSYNAALSMGNKILQNSFIDFMD